MKKHYKTIVISDVHLGTSGSKTKQLLRFLKQNTCETIILNGDIIDGWQLKRSGKWKRKHTRFFKMILKMIDRHKTKVIYLRGNHDDFLDQVLPLRIGKLSIERDYVYESFGKKYYITHGDIFDSVTTKLKFLAKLGDIGYTFLLWLNKRYNQYRANRGLPYYSLSQKIKAKVKSAVSYIDDFEKELANFARLKECDGIICGHIHQPAIKEIDGISYMNSGDWVESLTALTEDFQGNWEIVEYTTGIDIHAEYAKDDDADDEIDDMNDFNVEDLVKQANEQI
ncbi:MAG: UDP-2,3-diacylglucosamine diphosphatase [Thermonemataceae bacterium]|nr:UDP-2,3-diacylglucosamine diphosphatase [Thermonemataceae bacterium]